MSDSSPPSQAASVPGLLADVAAALGRHPAHSAVVVGFRDQRLTFVARFDLPAESLAVDPTSDATAEAAQVLHDIAVQGHGLGSVNLVVVGYGDAAPVITMFEVATAVFTVHGLTVMHLFRVTGERYFEHRPDQPTSTGGGTPFTLPPRPTRTTAGAPPQAHCAADPGADTGDDTGDDTDAEAVLPVTGDAATAMRVAHKRVMARLKAMVLPAPPTGLVERVDTTVGEDLGRLVHAVVDNAMRTCHAGGTLDDDAAAELIVLLGSDVVLDYAYVKTDNGDGRYLQLWLDLTRRAMPGFVTGPACLAAYLAWRAHQPSLARHCVGRALRDDPGNPFAVLIQQLLDEDIPPHLAHYIALLRNAGGAGR
ncbi:DUF4192 domain-containing protein [Dactylosporangium aurantiacum]|uniref:DUF4192 domain-containing protein n=2 Tax=Dactylosporangium aurantiacum TaxID=35754 RepID=A0A9Q9INL2_9ACTN|nr:DUF4192 domain-containing protein [Dactylosporangium aurantiacum]MDG6104024.1 DUF4192 domain-containing protein [Dactylosporangium aurantiacum]UWZ58801.1 DUF4192 domain-containing protein [Dactylosporangium aurantiacum]